MMKKSTLALGATLAVCAACCAPLFAPILTALGVSGMAAWLGEVLACCTADIALCIGVPAALGGPLLFFAYRRWRAARRVAGDCGCADHCSVETRSPDITAS